MSDEHFSIIGDRMAPHPVTVKPGRSPFKPRFKEEAMECHRCHGRMSPEELWTDQGKIVMSRCVFCGNVVDPLMMENRSRSEASLARMLQEEALEEKRFQHAGARRAA